MNTVVIQNDLKEEQLFLFYVIFCFQGLKLVLSSVTMEEEPMETDLLQDPNGDK